MSAPSHSKVEDLKQVEAKCLQYTSKAKEYRTKASATIPVDLNFFSMLKKNEPQKWKEAVKKFMSEAL